MKPCPLELRQRMVGAGAQRTHTIAELADLFQVTERYSYKLLKLRRDCGELTPLPPRGGTDPMFNAARLSDLSQLAAQSPDATLKELQTLVRRHCRINVCLTTSWSALRNLNLTVKKTRRAAEADLRERAEALQPTLPVRRLWFLDEFGLKMTRTNARAPRGQRAVVYELWFTNFGLRTLVYELWFTNVLKRGVPISPSLARSPCAVSRLR